MFTICFLIKWIFLQLPALAHEITTYRSICEIRQSWAWLVPGFESDKKAAAVSEQRLGGAEVCATAHAMAL